jgi:sugar transferase EpsL
MLVVALLIRLRLGSPVLFKQVRPGRHARPFAIVKFRSMFPPRPGTEHIDTDGERTPPLGIWLRKLSLDELPQLFNVLKGEMSLIGPRPLRVDYVARFNAEQKRRLDVLPGVTGWAQVKGRNALSWEQKFELDVWYVDHVSFWLDLKILFLTVGKVLRPTDTVAEGHTSMPCFMGSGEPAKDMREAAIKERESKLPGS